MHHSLDFIRSTLYIRTTYDLQLDFNLEDLYFYLKKKKSNRKKKTSN